MWISPKTDFTDFELDELYWFIKTRKDNELGVNMYIMTMISRVPRQIISFNVDYSVQFSTIQGMVDSVPTAENYYTDGGCVYLGVDFFGHHRRNIHNKNDTHTIESTNCDIRHYLAGFRRRSRCFYRSMETVKAVLWLFVNAYNKFGEWKLKYFTKNPTASRDLGFNHTRWIKYG